MTLVVGLTGGIGSGKSTVADAFAALGAHVVDTDAIAHDLTSAQGGAISEIVAVFGAGVLHPDGTLDRAAMRRLVFSDPVAKTKLEAILHPMIRRESEMRCRNAGNAPYIILVVPLLVENDSYRHFVDRVLVVDCDESLQIDRVVARSALSRDEVKAIISTQVSRAERVAVADDLMVNDQGLDKLNALVNGLHCQYLVLAAAKRGDNLVQASC
jgi:dephospho-CoA kinase